MDLILMELENSTEKVWFFGECIKDIIKSESNPDIKQSSEEATDAQHRLLRWEWKGRDVTRLINN